ncbi:hypothetical protein HanRHA438_Chr17g0838761 [Helianthus annuus]|nr:hypothetical protein HanRHA438_Chr17g0838761 [Helianthus annuus]
MGMIFHQIEHAGSHTYVRMLGRSICTLCIEERILEKYKVYFGVQAYEMHGHVSMDRHDTQIHESWRNLESERIEFQMAICHLKFLLAND